MKKTYLYLTPNTNGAPAASQAFDYAAFELAMLDSVAQIVHETNAPWKDAFHFLYANWGNASMILSTDEEFAKRTSGKTNLPKVVLPSYVEGRVKRLDPFYREVFC